MRLWHKKNSARRPLLRTWVIILLFVVALVIFYKAFIGPGSRLVNEGTLRLHEKSVENAQNQLDAYLDCETEEIEAVGKILAAVENEQQRNQLLHDFVHGEEWLRAITLLDRQGKVLYQATQFDNQEGIGEEHIRALPGEIISLPAAGKIFITSLEKGDQTFPSMVVSVPARVDAGAPRYIMVAEFSMQEIRDIIDEVDRDSQGQAYLTDGKGNILAHANHALALKKTNVIGRNVVQEVVTKKEAVQKFIRNNLYVNEKGDNVYVVGMPLQLADWGVFVEHPVRSIEASYAEVKIAGLILGPTLALLLLSLIFNEGALVGAFSDLEKGRDSLSAKVKKESKELHDLDKATKLLMARDQELQATNKKLDEKIKELEESKNKTLAIISNFIDPIVVLDKEGKISFFNPAAVRILGLDLADIGRAVPDKHNYSLKNFKDVFKTPFESKRLKGSPTSDIGNELSMEEIVLKPNGEELTYKVITARIIEEKIGDLGVMKIFYDLTREKAIDDMKSEFISVVAHQLRTPLSAIKWSLKMVLDGDAGKINKEQREFLLKGYESNDRMIQLVNDLLNVSRIEEGRFGYSFEIADIEEVLNDVVTEIQELMEARHIGLEIDKPASLPQLFIDKSKMGLVLENLLNNSLKYTPEYGKIILKITPREKEMLISVKDNGVGIPEADKPKIFKKFFRAANVVRMETEGSGLGLFMVKNIVEKHKGAINLESEEGKGTEVTIALPLVQVEA